MWILAQCPWEGPQTTKPRHRTPNNSSPTKNKLLCLQVGWGQEVHNKPLFKQTSGPSQSHLQYYYDQ